MDWCTAYMSLLGRGSIQKEREHRYASVGEFAADLRRHLANEPIEISAPTTWYRLNKFVRRNRAQSVAVAASLVAVCVAVVFLVLALQRANRETALKEQANRELRKRNYRPEMRTLVEPLPLSPRTTGVMAAA